MNKGITLVEWLVIVAIVALLAAMGIGAYEELHPKIQRNSILATNGVISSEKVLERFTLNRQLSGLGLPDLVVVQDTKEHEEYLIVIFHEHLAITPLLKEADTNTFNPVQNAKERPPVMTFPQPSPYSPNVPWNGWITNGQMIITPL